MLPVNEDLSEGRVAAEFDRAWNCFVGMDFLYSLGSRPAHYHNLSAYQYYEMLYQHIPMVDVGPCRFPGCNILDCDCTGMNSFKECLTFCHNNGEAALQRAIENYNSIEA